MSELALRNVAYVLISHVEVNGECCLVVKVVGDDDEAELAKIYSQNRGSYPDLDIRDEAGGKVCMWVQGKHVNANME